jgi:hypothetical protein
MARFPTPAAPAVVPSQVWSGLAPDLRLGAVRLLARLAHACATTPLNYPEKETEHVVQADNFQDLPRPS